MPDNVTEAKANLRSAVLSNRSTELADSTSADLALRLIELCHELGAKTVGIYLSFGSEPATDGFVVRAKAAGISLSAPRTGPEASMEFGMLEGLSKAGSLGFMQPTGEIVEPEQLDLIIAPALSIDHLGNRLGRGGGFFDRYLENYQGPVAAVVYDQEFVDQLPCESHDRPVHFAVTPTQVLKLPLTR